MLGLVLLMNLLDHQLSRIMDSAGVKLKSLSIARKNHPREQMNSKVGDQCRSEPCRFFRKHVTDDEVHLLKWAVGV